MADVIRASLRSLVERPPLPPVRYPPLLVLPPCVHCGKAHSIALVCPEHAWNHLQQSKGKTP